MGQNFELMLPLGSLGASRAKASPPWWNASTSAHDTAYGFASAGRTRGTRQPAGDDHGTAAQTPHSRCWNPSITDGGRATRALQRTTTCCSTVAGEPVLSTDVTIFAPDIDWRVLPSLSNWTPRWWCIRATPRMLTLTATSWWTSLRPRNRGSTHETDTHRDRTTAQCADQHLR